MTPITCDEGDIHKHIEGCKLIQVLNIPDIKESGSRKRYDNMVMFVDEEGALASTAELKKTYNPAATFLYNSMGRYPIHKSVFIGRGDRGLSVDEVKEITNIIER